MTDDSLANRFTYHAPNDEQKIVYQELRDISWGFAEKVEKYCPPSRERSLALTRIEEAVMWANAAIARHGLKPPEPPPSEDMF